MKEVKRKWMIPTPLEAVHNIKGAGIIPIGVATQHTLKEQGERIEKNESLIIHHGIPHLEIQ